MKFFPGRDKMKKPNTFTADIIAVAIVIVTVVGAVAIS